MSASNFEIRPIQVTDAAAVREAVLTNGEWLAEDFPNIATAYADHNTAQQRVAWLADQTRTGSGLSAYVAVEQGERGSILGVGTATDLGMRSKLVLGLGGFVRGQEMVRVNRFNLVAGWVIESAAGNQIGKRGLGVLLTTPHASRKKSASVTFIRQNNIAAQALASAYGMQPVTTTKAIGRVNEHEEAFVYSRRHLQLAGIDDGVKTPRQMWLTTPKRS